MAKKRLSLSIQITSLFFVLSVVIGTSLISISYYHSQGLIEQSAFKLSQENSKKLEADFQRNISPILTTLDLMATSSLPKKPPEGGRLNVWTDSIRLIFERNSSLTGLFYGSHDGSFTQFRPITPIQTKTFNAPPQTELLLNYYLAGRQNTFHFLGEDFHQVENREIGAHTYDPRTRPWYINASPDGKIVLSEPYEFFFIKRIGVTLSRLSVDGETVVAADFTLESLSERLKDITTFDSTKLAIFDNNFHLIAQHNLLPDKNDINTLDDVDLSDSVFSELMANNITESIYQQIAHADKEWQVTITPVNLTKKIRIYLAEAVPRDELLSELTEVRNSQIIVAFFLILLSFSLVWLAALRVTRPLNNLSKLTKNVHSFSFKKTLYPKSMIAEVNTLTDSIQLMEHTIHDLLKLLRETASKHDFESLAKTVCHYSYNVTKAETIVLQIKQASSESFDVITDQSIIPLRIDINDLLQSTPWMQSRLAEGEVIPLSRKDNCLTPYLDYFYNEELHLFPLLNRDQELIGILSIGYERTGEEDRRDKHLFLKELLGFVEIAKENIDQIDQRKTMLESFIELIASAIDTKSPYTGGHCQRVPVIAELLTQAADEDRRYFPDFSMDEKKWEELNFAAWLHDCGKVTTPEYVVDKATKLETIYDRIHEVRMRFELLKAQEEIECLKAIQEGANKGEQYQALSLIHTQLDEEFAFVARCNLGHQEMTESSTKRLFEIAAKTWVRTIDDQQGISWVERDRTGPPRETPCAEPLLCDKEAHFIPWEDGFNPKHTWEEEFNLTPSKLRHNRGELHNLSVKHGTLTDEERFVINDHIIQTITMLKRIPYPEHLRNVPNIAGNHHERMDGNGYPRGLKGEALSVQERVMVIADIFEALTSSDRPYKKTHSIGESLTIMTEMATSGHIDPKLYLLFLEKTIDSVYGYDFLNDDENLDTERAHHIQRVCDFIGDSF